MHAAHETIWQTIDQTLLGLAARAGDLDAELGRWLVAAAREGVHRHFGFASLAEYVERRLGFDARTTRERLRVARALESLPVVRKALATGERSWSAVREITRVATPENESAWVATTERMTVRQIEHLVAGRKAGDDPTDAKDPLLMNRRVAFELEAEAYADWCEAREAVRRMVGPATSDKEVFRAMCEIALGRRDETKPGYQISLTVCTRCDRAWRQAGPDAIEVSPSVGERAACDAEIVGFCCVDEGVAELADTTQAGPSANGVAVLGGAAHVNRTAPAGAGPVDAAHVGSAGVCTDAACVGGRAAAGVGPVDAAHVGSAGVRIDAACVGGRAAAGAGPVDAAHVGSAGACIDAACVGGRAAAGAGLVDAAHVGSAGVRIDAACVGGRAAAGVGLVDAAHVGSAGVCIDAACVGGRAAAGVGPVDATHVGSAGVRIDAACVGGRAAAGAGPVDAAHMGLNWERTAESADAAQVRRGPEPAELGLSPVPEAIAELLRTQGARGLVRAVSAYCGLELRAMTKATRQRIALRDNHRCCVPGCRNFRFIDVHHLRPRALGGKHDDDQLASLCKQHHDAIHDGRLAVEGKPSTGLRFIDARGEIYGARPTWGC